ncbi:hypothetical protein DPEC_G00349170 [Dallia pectoralis]|uniref:Uncharacterized protein n=1 Tax=Dallia pectoralis TaxID=75939 RepID=A0ACC2F1E9_DALPE|nr:hypothetical protein DPEC_G00349170 [Dallia pectoralis]
MNYIPQYGNGASNKAQRDTGAEEDNKQVVEICYLSPTLLSGNGITSNTSGAYQTAPHIRPLGKRLWGADTISSQNKAPGPAWTLVDTWSPNVTGHATDGSLIRHTDSHLFPSSPAPDWSPLRSIPTWSQRSAERLEIRGNGVGGLAGRDRRSRTSRGFSLR